MGKVKEPKRMLWKAIRLKCLDCSARSYKGVRLCSETDCPLHRYRFGHVEENSDNSG